MHQESDCPQVPHACVRIRLAQITICMNTTGQLLLDEALFVHNSNQPVLIKCRLSGENSINLDVNGVNVLYHNSAQSAQSAR